MHLVFSTSMNSKVVHLTSWGKIMNTNPIIALDFRNMEEVLTFLKPFDEQLFVKIGMELYLQNGPTIVKEVRDLGHDIFLDLKLHDIPNTVGQAMKGLAGLDIQMIDVHAAGGSKMMTAALDGLKAGGSQAHRRCHSADEYVRRDDERGTGHTWKY